MAKKKMTFEEALNRLEKLVQNLESGETPLEESIKAFEEGKELVNFCLSLLDKAEAKIKQLEENTDGSFQLTDFK
jgi:exodeoxyribonuclease VII small subunit